MRTCSISSIEKKIRKMENKFEKLKVQQNEIISILTDLQKHKQKLEIEQIMGAVRKSSRSMEEIMTFYIHELFSVNFLQN